MGFFRQEYWRVDNHSPSRGSSWSRNWTLVSCITGRFFTIWTAREALEDTGGKEPACQYRSSNRCGLDPWIRKIPQRRAWQPTPVFLPGESHGQRRSLAGYSPSGHKLRHDWSNLVSNHTQQSCACILSVPILELTTILLTSLISELTTSLIYACFSFLQGLGFHLFENCYLTQQICTECICQVVK